MFESQTRPIVYTQYEHGRLAGILARQWGNETFARPALEFDAFAAGVTLHDWGYGVVDNLPLGKASEDDWLVVMRNGVDKRFDDPTTDIVVKLHLRRLLSMHASAERETHSAQIDELVDTRLAESGLSLENFRRADKITQLCDMISFSYCFEFPIERTYEVFSRPDAAETTGITFEIRPGGEVIVDPWPFAVPDISGILYAFERQGYPEALNPRVIPFSIRRLAG